MTINYIKNYWDELETKFPMPKKVRKIHVIEFEDLRSKIYKSDEIFIKNIMKNIFEGDFYIFKNAFTEEFMIKLKTETFDYFKSKPSEFFQMLEGTPDFHRKINIEIGKKYAIKMCKHSFYFYPWNNDPLNIFETIYKRWRIIKKLMGLNENEYEKNTPKDGVVDRIQVVQYPSKIGYLEPHTDPHQNQRLIFSGYMSKLGKDFDGLGFYLIDNNNKIVEVEHLIDIGDIGIGYSSIYHGVAPVNINKSPNWDDLNDGRWFLSMYSNSSDELKSRVTSAGTPEKFDDKRLFPDLNYK